VMPQASMPSSSVLGRLTVPTARAAAVGLQTVKAPPVAVWGTIETSLTTIEVGMAGVSTLLIRSFLADSDTRAFGVTRQEQQATSSSDGSKA